MAQRDLTEIFGGLFFFLSLIYFSVMFFVLRDIKSSESNSIYSTNAFGEIQVVSRGDQVLDKLNI